MAYGCLCIMMFLICPATMQAQAIKVWKAMAQKGSGGIAGSRSCRYTFVLQGKNMHSVQADSLWVGDHATDLKDGRSCVPLAGFNGRVPTMTITTTVHLPNEYHAPVPPGNTVRKPPVAPPPPAYRGVALFIYHQRGKRHTLAIPATTEWLPEVSYP